MRATRRMGKMMVGLSAMVGMMCVDCHCFRVQ
jgi:hypothetical protein